MPRLSEEFRRSLEVMAGTYQRALTEAGRSYLLGRGIGPEAVERYRIGQVDDTHPEHADYAGMLCMPYLTRSGVVSLKFRRAHECGADCKHAKYISPYETRLFNTLAMDQADREGVLAVAEGELDTIVLDAYCGIPAVGVPGVDTYKKHPEWRELLRGYETVLIFKDNDPEQIRKRPDGSEEKFRPGDELAKAIRRDVDAARIVRLPSKDVNDTYIEFGRDGVRGAAGL